MAWRCKWQTVVHGTTDEKEIEAFLDSNGPKIIYSTFTSFADLLLPRIAPEDVFLLVDECHNLTGDLLDADYERLQQRKTTKNT